jgi:hypothetical protein
LALWQENNKETNDIWTKEWQASIRHRCFMAKDTIPPSSQKFLTLTSNHSLACNSASLIFQLCTGHAPLNSYLHQFQKADSAQCPACGDPCEMAEHFLLNCPKYAYECWPLIEKLNRTRPSLIDMLSNQKTILSLINFIDTTGRFCRQQEHRQEVQTDTPA